MQDGGTTMPPTFLGIGRVLRAVIVLGFAAVAAAIGWCLPWIAEWALSLDWSPMRGPLRLIDSAPEPWLSVGAAVLGLLAGGWLGVAAIVESLAVTVADDQVRLRIDGTTRTFDRAQVGAVFLDDRLLVLLDPAGRELAREKPEVSAREVADGFRAHGFPWAEADPHRDGYRLWVPEMPGLPDGGNALLSARSRALSQKQKDDVRELRREVAALGIVVRDEGTRQYWRLAPPR
jgi:hypothetical protein